MTIDTALSNVERQERMLRFVEQRQRVTVADICDQFGVSVATARRDLEALAERGSLRRIHGGALAIHRAPPELPALQRAGEQAAEKRRIGRAAAALMADGETVFLSSGTTTLEVARSLRGQRRLTVITNSLLALNVRADKLIIGIRAIDAEQGLTNDFLPETMTDRAIMRVAREVIVVADHSKCGRVSAAFVAPLSAMRTLVTDSGASPEFVGALTAQGIRVLAV